MKIDGTKAYGAEVVLYDRGRDDRDALGAGLAAEAEGDILLDGQVREERVVLEDHADPAFFRRQALAFAADHVAVQTNFATGDFFKAGNAAQKRRFATAGWPKQAGDLTGSELEIDAVDDGGRAVALDDRIQFKLFHGGRL